MDKKYRVNELAKDLNIPVSEITDVVQEYFGVQKKSRTTSMRPLAASRP